MDNIDFFKSFVGENPFVTPARPELHDVWPGREYAGVLSGDFPIKVEVLEQMVRNPQTKYDYEEDGKVLQVNVTLEVLEDVYGSQFIHPKSRVYYEHLVKKITGHWTWSAKKESDREKEVKVVSSGTHKKVMSVYPYFMGPDPRSIVWYEGEGGDRICNSDGIDYLVSKVKKGSVPLQVPEAVIQVYAISISSSGKLSDPTFYESHMKGYSMWTYEIHKPSLEMILNQIPAHDLICAPGDGMGVVSSMRKNVISGDRVIVPGTHVRVRRETLMETIRRGRRHKAKVIILAYVQQFLTDTEIKEVQSGTEKVFVIDPTSVVLQRWSLFSVGQGVFSNYRSDEIPNVDVSSFSMVLYSENILQQGYVVTSWSPPLEYAYQMNPLLPLRYEGDVVRKRPERGDPEMYFAYSVKEAKMFLSEGKRVYFYGIGKPLECISYVKLRPNVQISPRWVYHSRERVEIPGFTVEESDNGCYFYASLEKKKDPGIDGQHRCVAKIDGKKEVKLSVGREYLGDGIYPMFFPDRMELKYDCGLLVLPMWRWRTRKDVENYIKCEVSPRSLHERFIAMAMSYYGDVRNWIHSVSDHSDLRIVDDKVVNENSDELSYWDLAQARHDRDI